jgi:hypothetical protein
MSVAGGGGVFVSYRRECGGDAAGRLADRLVDRFGLQRVFMDVDTIEPGMDYAEAITRAIGACNVLVAVIGPGWLTATNRRGRRLDDPYDWVRIEVGTALARGIRVIPVLVGGVDMPGREDLPEDLAGLARRNALRMRHESFRADAGQLVAVVERVLAPGTTVIPNAEAAGRDVSRRNEKAKALRNRVPTVVATDPERAERTSIRRLRHNRGEDIWPDDGISDEDYWASVVADRPLTLTRKDNRASAAADRPPTPTRPDNPSPIAADRPLTPTRKDNRASAAADRPLTPTRPDNRAPIAADRPPTPREDIWPDDGISDEDYWASVAADRPPTPTRPDNRAPANGGK